MPWVYNYDGDLELQGWVYQEGDWSWGCVLTWHVTDLGDEYGSQHDYVWTCYMWVYNWYQGWWYRKVNVPIFDAAPEEICWRPWMEHCRDGAHLVYS